MEYHVAKNGNDNSKGTKEQPFLTISRAAKVAQAGDKVIVHKGEYREWVKPEYGGLSNWKRICYETFENEKVIIKGSERIQNWEIFEGTVWRTVLSNTIFGNYNPYTEKLWGDWLEYPVDYSVHTGEVYLNGKSFYEAPSLEHVKNPQIRIKGANPPWLVDSELILYPRDTIYQWFAEVGQEETILYANFQGVNPNEELVEINVRRCCFYPEKTGLNYITVKGFEMAHAACPWAPPTAEQYGLLGAHWSKGWIIENNHIHDAKCSGISIGKERTTGHNLSTRYRTKPGYQYQMEAVFLAKQIGWDKETIGSHIIKDNIIHDCGQNGIVGHMGCIFSRIERNHIYNIGIKHEFFGYEIAGIKLHAAIDVQIVHNNIHHCSLGTWLDWQAQGTRISKNLYYENNRDLMLEVTHGPHLIDNNIFASSFNLDNVAQGGAYVHNLFCGVIRRAEVRNRATPYHFPHSTDIAGTTFVYSGDDRFYQNIFVGNGEIEKEHGKEDKTSLCHGTAIYMDCTNSLKEYAEIAKEKGLGDVEMFEEIQQPAYINHNLYYQASALEWEASKCSCNMNPKIHIYERDGSTWLEITVGEEIQELPTELITTETLGNVRIVEAWFEQPDGSDIILNTDYFDTIRQEKPVVGPFENMLTGVHCFEIWK